MVALASADIDQSASLCLLPFRHVDRPNLYYVHEISGSVLHFAPIARQLDTYRNVIGLQCIGLAPGFAADRTVEEMADRYLGVIDRQGYPPPYDIIGYSMGGLVAFEMALRLPRHGRPVRLLGLIDPPCPGSMDRLDPARVTRMMARNLGIESVVTADEQDADRLLELLVVNAQLSGVLPATYTVDDMRAMVELHLINGHAAASYRPPRRYPGNVRLLCAGRDTPAAKVNGWRGFVRGYLLDEKIDADHFSMVRGENLFTVADVLLRWLTESSE